MRGRRPRPLEIAPHDVPILQQIARSRSLPWYQVQRAQVLLAVAAGEPIRTLAIRTQCNPSTVWRICRRYEDAGLPDLLEPPQRAGRPARISALQRAQIVQLACLEPVAKGLPHHPLDEPGSGPSSGRRWDRPGHQRSRRSKPSTPGGPPAASHAVLADVSHRHSLQGACREDPLVLRQRRAVGPAGLLGGLLPMRNPTSKSWNDIPSGIRSPARSRSVSSITRGTARSNILFFLIVHSGQMEAARFDAKLAQHDVQELRAFRHRHRHLRVDPIHDNDPTHTAAKTKLLPGGEAPAGGEVASPRSTPRGSTKRSCWSVHSVTTT